MIFCGRYSRYPPIAIYRPSNFVANFMLYKWFIFRTMFFIATFLLIIVFFWFDSVVSFCCWENSYGPFFYIGVIVARTYHKFNIFAKSPSGIRIDTVNSRVWQSSAILLHSLRLIIPENQNSLGHSTLVKVVFSIAIIVHKYGLICREFSIRFTVIVVIFTGVIF